MLYFTYYTKLNIPGPILESKGMRASFQKKGKKRAKNGKIFENFGKKCTKFEVFLKKGSLVRATSARMKQLEYALYTNFKHGETRESLTLNSSIYSIIDRSILFYQKLLMIKLFQI